LLLPLLAAALVHGGCAGAWTDDAGSTGRRAVVLIVVDALRADHLGTYGYKARETSPNIDRWAERGRVFERAYATSSWTLPSFGSILTGRLPSAHSAGIEGGDTADVGVEVVAARPFLALPPGVPTVAEILAAEGFATGAFVANPFLEPRFGLNRGFIDYDHYDTSNEELRSATEVVDLALGWIDAHADRSLFLMVHLFDPHLDYDAPAPFRGRFAVSDEGAFELPVRGMWPIRNRIAEMSAAERDFIAAAYDEELAYVDAEVGRLLQGLQDRGILESGLVALTADHGEELFEHDGFEHGHSMYEEVLRVPMILWGPGVSAGRDDFPVSLVDVAPTVLAAAGAAVGNDLPGVVLLDEARAERPRQRAIIAERPLYGPRTKAIVRWPHKAILEIDSGAAMLFDLVADPGEHDDLAARRPEKLRALLGELSARLAEAKALGVGVQAELDEDLLRRLRALGYIR